MSLTIVLVEPAGPLNVGSVARVMKNFGLRRLVLVNPQCDRLGREALQMAIHARDLLEEAIEVATLPEALAGCDRVGATIGRDWDSPVSVREPAAALPWLRARVSRMALKRLRSARWDSRPLSRSATASGA